MVTQAVWRSRDVVTARAILGCDFPCVCQTARMTLCIVTAAWRVRVPTRFTSCSLFSYSSRHTHPAVTCHKALNSGVLTQLPPFPNTYPPSTRLAVRLRRQQQIDQQTYSWLHDHCDNVERTLIKKKKKKIKKSLQAGGVTGAVDNGACAPLDFVSWLTEMTDLVWRDRPACRSSALDVRERLLIRSSPGVHAIYPAYSVDSNRVSG